MAEVAPASGGGANRTFLLLVLGLAGLLLIGLVAVAAVFFAPALLPKAPVAAATLTATRVAINPTNTPPKPTAAPTLVVNVAAATSTAPTSAPTAAPTSAPTAAPTVAVAQSSSLPEGGLGEDLLTLGGGMVLVLVLFTARRARVA